MIAVYSNRDRFAEGPHVEVTKLLSELNAASALRVACVTCAFQVSLGSSQTPSTRSSGSVSTWWPAICTVDWRSALLCLFCLVKWISLYFSGANFAPCRRAHSRHFACAVSSLRQFCAAVAPHAIRLLTRTGSLTVTFFATSSGISVGGK